VSRRRIGSAWATGATSDSRNTLDAGSLCLGEGQGEGDEYVANQNGQRILPAQFDGLPESELTITSSAEPVDVEGRAVARKRGPAAARRRNVAFNARTARFGA